MILIVPMAGRGQRFSDAGFTVPKPFIDVRGEWIVEWALKGFDLSAFSTIIFLVLKEHDRTFNAVHKLKEKYGDTCVCVLVDQVTEGPACTVLLAQECIDVDEGVVIKDCDGYIISDVQNMIEEHKDSNLSGILSTSSLPGERWSFARTDEAGRVVEVAEKKRISDNAITGLYYFRRGTDFVWYAKKIISENRRVAQGEFYMSTVFQQMIEDEKYVVINTAEKFWDLGTPETLKYFLEHYEH